MKKNIAAIVAAVACLLAALCLVRISALEKNIVSLNSGVESRLSQLDGSVRSTYYQIIDQLEAQDDLLASSSADYGALDATAGTVEITCSIIPKVYYPEVTQAFLVSGGAEHAMTLAGGQYTVTLSVPISEEFTAQGVRFYEDGAVRAQELNWNMLPRLDFLPFFNISFDNRSTGTVSNGAFVEKRNGLLVINVDGRGNELESLDVVYRLDGAEIERTTVDMSYEAQQSYAQSYNTTTNSGSSSATAVRVMPERKAYVAGDYSELFYRIDETREIPAGSTLECFIEAVDENGLRYVTMWDSRRIGSNGHPDDAWRPTGTATSIYSPDGTPLYEAEENLYW